MKKYCISFLVILIIILLVISFFFVGAEKSYLRIHIRANSNSKEDQAVKYLVKDKIVEYLTPFVAECETFLEAKQVMQNQNEKLTEIANKTLLENGFTYGAKVEIKNELFPTRCYEKTTLDGGYYDALIVGLGSAKGDNWWCVLYPPLCFSNGNGKVEYRSKIAQIIKEFFKGENDEKKN